MTTLALGSIQTRPLPLNWRRISALSGSFSAHIAIIILLLIPTVAMELKRVVVPPEVTHGRILPSEPEARPAPPLPVPVQRQKVVTSHPKPTITMEAPTRIVSDAPANVTNGPVTDSGDHAAAPSNGAAGIGAGDSTPSALSYGNVTNIPYPIIALRNHEQGTVMLRVLVGADGKPQQVEVDHTSGSHALDIAARDAVRHWTFKPGTRGGVTYAAWAIVPVSFSFPG